jgi:hypothetical protein
MNVENKIRELLNKKQLSEENAGPMGAAKGKDTSIPAKTAGDAKNPRQGSSEDATIASERDQETDNPGAKEASPIADNKSKISQSGAGAAPNFTTVADPRSVVNQASSKGNVHQEEYDPEEDEDESEEFDFDLFESIMLDEGDLSIRTLYNKYADHALGAGDKPEPKKAAAVKKAIVKVHGATVMGHLEKAKNAAAKNDQDSESTHFNNARSSAKSDTMRATVGKNRSSMRNEEFELEEADFAADLATLFDGNQDLSEEFRDKASSLFEAMVVARVSNEVSIIEDTLVAEAAELMEEYKSELVEKVDSYLGYVIENWIQENQLAVENGLRTDIAEDFIEGLKTLFAEHYVDVPEDKYDVLGEMQSQIEEISSKLDEAIAANVELHDANLQLNKESVLSVVAEGLAKTDAEKFKSLVADVEFENADIFEEKLNVIKENYFPKTRTLSEEKFDDGVDNDFSEGSTVSKYVKALDVLAAKN